MGTASCQRWLTAWGLVIVEAGFVSAGPSIVARALAGVPPHRLAGAGRQFVCGFHLIADFDQFGTLTMVGISYELRGRQACRSKHPSPARTDVSLPALAGMA